MTVSSSNPILPNHFDPNQYEIALVKGSAADDIQLVKKGLWTLIGKYIYSTTYSYDLVKIKQVLERISFNNNPAIPSAKLIPIYKNIYEREVREYKSSIWRRLFKTNPQITSLQKQNKSALNILQSLSYTPTTVTFPPKIKTPATSLPKKHPDLPAVPVNGIKVGLPNITEKGVPGGNTCWLNSILKFISTGTEFDDMLVRKPPAGSEKAQKLFREMISTLRTGQLPGSRKKVKTIPNDMYEKFLNSLIDLKNPANPALFIIPRNEGIGHEQEAAEFLRQFAAAFGAPAFGWKEDPILQAEIDAQKNFPRRAITYTPTENTPNDLVKLPTHNSSMPIIDINISNRYLEDPMHLDLETLAADSEVVTALALPGVPNSGNFEWNLSKHFTNLPPTMLVSLNRLVIDQDGNQEKIENPVKLEHNGFISFVEHTPIYEHDVIVGLKPSRICRYRIETSITHVDVASGHYICEERTGKGQMIVHSDTSVSPKKTKTEFGTAGSLLRLKLVETLPISIEPQIEKLEDLIDELLLSTQESIALDDDTLSRIDEIREMDLSSATSEEISENITAILTIINQEYLKQKVKPDPESIETMSAIQQQLTLIKN